MNFNDDGSELKTSITISTCIKIIWYSREERKNKRKERGGIALSLKVVCPACRCRWLEEWLSHRSRISWVFSCDRGSRWCRPDRPTSVLSRSWSNRLRWYHPAGGDSSRDPDQKGLERCLLDCCSSHSNDTPNLSIVISYLFESTDLLSRVSFSYWVRVDFWVLCQAKVSQVKLKQWFNYWIEISKRFGIKVSLMIQSANAVNFLIEWITQFN